jgi:hypothetical protein
VKGFLALLGAQVPVYRGVLFLPFCWRWNSLGSLL